MTKRIEIDVQGSDALARRKDGIAGDVGLVTIGATSTLSSTSSLLLFEITAQKQKQKKNQQKRILKKHHTHQQASSCRVARHRRVRTRRCSETGTRPSSGG